MARPTAVGCHIYAGGFTLGVREHFNVLAHFEEWPFGVETARYNFEIPVFVGKDKWPKTGAYARPDLVYGNPPCAPWSQANSRGGMAWQSDPRVQYWADVLGLLDSLRPVVWACESVRGIYLRGQGFLDPYLTRARRRGYRATHVLCNALEHGVPQSRPRYFLVLSQVDLPWAPTGLKRAATIADAWRRAFKTHTQLDDGSKYDRFLKRARPGEDLRATFNRVTPPDRWRANAHGGVAGRPPFSWKRLREEGQSHVITGGRSFIHPTEHRFLSVEEQAALCGYPRWFKFKGKVPDQYAQIGKAVMPPVAEYLAGVIARGLRKGERPPVLAAEEVTVRRDAVDRRDSEIYRGPVAPWQPPESVADKKRKENLEHGRAVRSVRSHAGAPLRSRGNGAARRGSGYRIREMLVQGRSTDDILRVIHEEFPESTAKAGDVYWNRRKLKQQGGRP